MITAALVALLGGIGASLRYALSQVQRTLPWGILIANTLAAGVAAYALVLNTDASVLLISGLAGGLSTFSTLIANTADFWRKAEWKLGWLNLALNIVIPSTFAVAISTIASALLK